MINNIIDIVLSISLVLYAIASQKMINELKEQNDLLYEALDVLLDDADMYDLQEITKECEDKEKDVEDHEEG